VHNKLGSWYFRLLIWLGPKSHLLSNDMSQMIIPKSTFDGENETHGQMNSVRSSQTLLRVQRQCTERLIHTCMHSTTGCASRIIRLIHIPLSLRSDQGALLPAIVATHGLWSAAPEGTATPPTDMAPGTPEGIGTLQCKRVGGRG